MKTLITDINGNLSIVEVDKPKCSDYTAVVKTVSCGICNGTDMKIIHNSFKGIDQYPTILGHEGVGQVVELGSKVKYLKEGDYVLLPFLDEGTNGYGSAWGAYSEYAVVHDRLAMFDDGLGNGYTHGQNIVPSFVDPVEAAMIITFREVLSAMRRFGFFPNANIVVFGAGPVGLCFTKFSKLIGVDKVIVCDVIDEKVEEALKMGADYAFNSTKVDVVSEIKKILPEGADFIVDAVGNTNLINLGMNFVKDHGNLCCYGISKTTNMQLDWSKAPYNFNLLFIQMPVKQEETWAYNQILNWIKMGVIKISDFIAEIVDFKDIISAFDKVAAGKAGGKIIVKY